MRNLVVWLEDTKICKYKIDGRAALREVDGPKWAAAFAQYLSDLHCECLHARICVRVRTRVCMCVCA